MIQFDKRLPVYEQIIDYVKKQIVSGEWELGKELPSRREFATPFDDFLHKRLKRFMQVQSK